MDKVQKTLWFKRKRYGWGWTPVTIRGWFVVIAYIAFVVICAAWFGSTEELSSGTGLSFFVLILLSSTSLLLWISYKHGPMPKWRWGKKATDDPALDF